MASARALVDRVRAARLLTGWRGSRPLDVDALVRTLVALSRFAVDHADTDNCTSDSTARAATHCGSSVAGGPVCTG